MSVYTLAPVESDRELARLSNALLDVLRREPDGVPVGDLLVRVAKDQHSSVDDVASALARIPEEQLAPSVNGTAIKIVEPTG